MEYVRCIDNACSNIILVLQWKQTSKICFERQVGAGSCLCGVSTVRAGFFRGVKSERQHIKRISAGTTAKSKALFKKNKQIEPTGGIYAGFINLNFYVHRFISWQSVSEHSFRLLLFKKRSRSVETVRERKQKKKPRLLYDKHLIPPWIMFQRPLTGYLSAYWLKPQRDGGEVNLVIVWAHL